MFYVFSSTLLLLEHMLQDSLNKTSMLPTKKSNILSTPDVLQIFTKKHY
jgi:hypothetical protein